MSAPADPRIPPPERCILPYQLDHWARLKPEAPYVVFEDGSHWSFAEMRARVHRLAAGLQGLGVVQGDHVAVWLPNGPQALLAFFAINTLGAVFVPFNTAYRGAILAHVLDLSDARIAIVHAGLVERLAEVAHRIATVVVAGDPQAPLRLDDLMDCAVALRPTARPIAPWDPQSIIFTSGTTGPSKGVLSSYLHLYSNAGPETWPFVTGADRFLVNMPIFHIGGMGLPAVMLARGGSIALMENFSTERFWAVARTTGTTAMFLLGVMATFLLKAPADPRDRDHKVRLALMVPFTDEAEAFRARFGIDLYTIFNMTEVASPTVSGPNPGVQGTCGTVRPGVEVRLVDAHDVEVPIGQVGEMIVRCDRPWAMNSGYYKNPEATAQAWRNGWFHTGDAFCRDGEGNFFFVDRVKDAIRRRGENISSFEVETAVMAHPDVAEAAAIGVPSPYGEDDVMAVVAPAAGRTLDPVELIAFLERQLPYFMVPRYVRCLTPLPKTPTAKVRKAVLRGEGVTADTWDREAAGLKLKRERLAG